MAAKKNRTTNIRKYRKHRKLNIGIFIFILVFFYLIISISLYAVQKKVSVYEVRKGSIVRDNSYTGLILRTEQVVNADTSGFISYFQNENNKVKAGSNIYAISEDRLNTDPDMTMNIEDALPGAESQNNVILKTQSFNENYNAQKFSSVYSLKEEITSILQDVSNQTKTAKLDAAIAQSDHHITICQSARDGIVVLTIDGYETLTEDTLCAEDFDRNKYQASRLEDHMEIRTGDPVYKLVTDEKWKVYVQLTQEAAEELKDTTYVKTRIDKDSETIWADFSILRKNDGLYGCLAYDNSMIRYAQDRFLNVELILEDQSGLKIPKSAVIQKTFYEIPVSYVKSEESTFSDGFMVEDETGIYFQPVDLYYTDSETSVYVHSEDLTQGTTLVIPETSDTYEVQQICRLPGVYTINTGYAMFKIVEILCENDDYYIIKEGGPYELSNYDHIALDGSIIEDGEFLFQ